MTTKDLENCVSSEKPIAENPATAEQESAIRKWEKKDFLCRNYILNSLADELYDYYSTLKTAKEIWDTLTKKYDTEEAGIKNMLSAAI